MSKKYNGWTNYETWVCNLWMDELDAYFSELAHRAYDEARADKLFTRLEIASFALAEQIQQHWEELASEIKVTGFFADILNAGISSVNWQELARARLNACEFECALSI